MGRPAGDPVDSDPDTGALLPVPPSGQSSPWAPRIAPRWNRRSDPQPPAGCMQTLTVFTSLACSPLQSKGLGEGYRLRTTIRPRIPHREAKDRPDRMAD